AFTQLSPRVRPCPIEQGYVWRAQDSREPASSGSRTGVSESAGIRTLLQAAFWRIPLQPAAKRSSSLPRESGLWYIPRHSEEPTRSRRFGTRCEVGALEGLS